MSRRTVVELPQAPSADDLKAAASHGMTYLAWRDAGKPISELAGLRNPANSEIQRIMREQLTRSPRQAPSVRPWYPYRSKWEWEYAKYLESLRHTLRVAYWDYEPESLTIGIGSRYTPDFRVTYHGGRREWHEVKGYRREAAMVRLRVAAKLYPQFRFVLVTKRDGQWVHQTIGAKS